MVGFSGNFPISCIMLTVFLRKIRETELLVIWDRAGDKWNLNVQSTVNELLSEQSDPRLLFNQPTRFTLSPSAFPPVPLSPFSVCSSNLCHPLVF